jgi:hypothetical protein
MLEVWRGLLTILDSIKKEIFLQRIKQGAGLGEFLGTN